MIGIFIYCKVFYFFIGQYKLIDYRRDIKITFKMNIILNTFISCFKKLR